MVWRLSSMLKSTLLKHVPITWIFARTSVGLSYKIIAENDTDPDVPPLFLFHGLLGCKKHWEGLGKTLLSLTKRSVVVVDLRNHGDSPHVASHTYEELAADVLRLLEKLDIDKACLIGHSMGGRASMCSSLMAPEKVLGLLVVDISPISSPPFLTEYLPKVLSAMKAVEFDRPKNIRKARKMAKRQLKGLITDDLVMRAVLSNVNIKNEGKIGWTCNLDALINNFGHIKSFPSSMKGKKYQGPTLFVGGQLSDFIPPDDLTNIREFFPYAVIVTRLRDEVKTGHNLHVEEPKTFLEYVIAFVKTLP